MGYRKDDRQVISFVVIWDFDTGYLPVFLLFYLRFIKSCCTDYCIIYWRLLWKQLL